MCRDNEKCQRKPCWFMHSERDEIIDNTGNPQNKNETKQDFQKDPVKQKPPISPKNQHQKQN